MQIDDRKYVAIEYKLTLPSGEEIDSSPAGEPFGFITGAGQVIPGLEKALMGKSEGDQEKIVIEPEEGYGAVKENLVQDIPRSQFPEGTDIAPGMSFQAQGPQGPIMLTVKELKDDETVTVDLNHPLAGKQLHFEVKVAEVREPTAAEIAQLQQQAAACGCGCGTDQQADCGSGCCG
jgi:FKBP-type peptidyl-prolyl cis-trans isomerase SlyD